MSGTGAFVVTWGEQDGTNAVAKARRYSNSGTPLGTVFSVATVTDYDEISPAVGIADGGDFVVVWHDYDSSKIRARLFDDGDSPVGTAFDVTTAAYGYEPDVAMNGAGAFIVTWGDQVGYDAVGRARRYDEAGSPVGAAFPVATVENADEIQTSIGMDAGGAFVVVWDDYYTYAVFGQRFTSQGALLGTEFTVTDAGSGGDADVAMDAAGNFIVAWGEKSGDDAIAMVRQYDSDGDPVGTSFPVATAEGFDEITPDVGIDGEGNFVVIWQEYFEGPVLGQRFAPTGCAQPVTTGPNPTASDCLFILKAAIGSETCNPVCVCNPTGDANVTAADALLCLKNAVGQSVTLSCPCS